MSCSIQFYREKGPGQGERERENKSGQRAHRNKYRQTATVLRFLGSQQKEVVTGFCLYST